MKSQRSYYKYELLQLESKSASALAEETRATQSALESLKRNHELELAKEINNFKQEFFNSINIKEFDNDTE